MDIHWKYTSFSFKNHNIIITITFNNFETHKIPFKQFSIFLRSLYSEPIHCTVKCLKLQLDNFYHVIPSLKTNIRVT